MLLEILNFWVINVPLDLVCIDVLYVGIVFLIFNFMKRLSKEKTVEVVSIGVSLLIIFIIITFVVTFINIDTMSGLHVEFYNQIIGE